MGKASSHAARPRSVRQDTSEAQICAMFASARTARSLCVGPLGLGAGVFFDRVVANGHSASVYVGLFEMP
jgi:hypothetical protein